MSNQTWLHRGIAPLEKVGPIAKTGLKGGSLQHSLSLITDSPLLPCMSRAGSADRHQNPLDFQKGVARASTSSVRQRRQAKGGKYGCIIHRDPACRLCQPHPSLRTLDWLTGNTATFTQQRRIIAT